MWDLHLGYMMIYSRHSDSDCNYANWLLGKPCQMELIDNKLPLYTSAGLNVLNWMDSFHKLGCTLLQSFGSTFIPSLSSIGTKCKREKIPTRNLLNLSCSKLMEKRVYFNSYNDLYIKNSKTINIRSLRKTTYMKIESLSTTDGALVNSSP